MEGGTLVVLAWSRVDQSKLPTTPTTTTTTTPTSRMESHKNIPEAFSSVVVCLYSRQEQVLIMIMIYDWV